MSKKKDETIKNCGSEIISKATETTQPSDKKIVAEVEGKLMTIEVSDKEIVPKEIKVAGRVYGKGVYKNKRFKINSRTRRLSNKTRARGYAYKRRDRNGAVSGTEGLISSGTGGKKNG